MTEAKHTPGPWHVEQDDDALGHFTIRDEDDYPVCEVSNHYADYDMARAYWQSDECRMGANAELLATATKLLAALRPLAALPVGAEIAEDRTLVLYKNAGRAVTVGDILDARAAIASAKGDAR